MQKVILYYLFTPIEDPEAIMLWQKTLAGSLNLKGRILISKHGINGTLGGDIDDVKNYVKQNKSYKPFKKIAYKWSESNEENTFPKLSIKVRDEIVTFNAAEELKVDSTGVVGGGKHLKPNEVNDLVKERGDDVVFFDGRNLYEAKIGRFKNAITPDVRTAKDFVPELESGKYDHLKDKAVITYCTGGIRCEILSALMKNRDFKEVYQIDGGIVKYAEQYGEEGLWEGSLYVFDGRMNVEYSEQPKVIGECIHCAGATSNYRNCELKSCNNLVLICSECEKDKSKIYDTKECYEEATSLELNK